MAQQTFIRITEKSNRVIVGTYRTAPEARAVLKALVKLPVNLVYSIEQVDSIGRKVGNDVHAVALTNGVRFIHRDSKQPHADHYLIVTGRFTLPDLSAVVVNVRTEFGKETAQLRFPLTKLVELFDAQNPTFRR